MTYDKKFLVKRILGLFVFAVFLFSAQALGFETGLALVVGLLAMLAAARFVFWPDVMSRLQKFKAEAAWIRRLYDVLMIALLVAGVFLFVSGGHCQRLALCPA